MQYTAVNRKLTTAGGPWNRLGFGHVRGPPVPAEAVPALGHPGPVHGAVAGFRLGHDPHGRAPEGLADGLGGAGRRPRLARRLAGGPAGRTRAAAGNRPVPACRLGPPAGQPGVPADLRVAGGAGDGAMAVAAAIP